MSVGGSPASICNHTCVCDTKQTCGDEKRLRPSSLGCAFLFARFSMVTVALAFRSRGPVISRSGVLHTDCKGTQKFAGSTRVTADRRDSVPGRGKHARSKKMSIEGSIGKKKRFCADKSLPRAPGTWIEGRVGSL